MTELKSIEKTEVLPGPRGTFLLRIVGRDSRGRRVTRFHQFRVPKSPWVRKSIGYSVDLSGTYLKESLECKNLRQALKVYRARSGMTGRGFKVTLVRTVKEIFRGPYGANRKGTF